MKVIFYALMAMSLVSIQINAEEVEEVVVTASFIDQNISEIENPLHVVVGNDISDNVTQSLGESLDGLLGVTSTDYGSAVGQPVIRGISGNRVKVLNNGMVVRDVSGIGGDHINDVDLNDIQQIEVVRGPSSLLYSNGTVGGIINIVDNTIPRADIEYLELKIGVESQSVNDGDSQNFSYANNIGGINLTLAYKDSKFGNFDVPHGAIIHSEEHEDEHGEEHEEGHEEEGHEDERIFSSTESDVFNLEGSIALSNNFIKKADFYFRDTDYSLTEQHAEEAHEDEHEDEHEGHSEGPTLFKNDAKEYGVTFDLGSKAISQKIVFKNADEKMSIIGEESFMNPTDSDELSIGYYVSAPTDLFHIDFGLRHDRIS